MREKGFISKSYKIDTATEKPVRKINREFKPRFLRRDDRFSRRPLTLEQEVDILEKKVNEHGVTRIVKRRITNDVNNYIKLADERGIILVEEDDALLIFGKEI